MFSGVRPIPVISMGTRFPSTTISTVSPGFKFLAFAMPSPITISFFPSSGSVPRDKTGRFISPSDQDTRWSSTSSSYPYTLVSFTSRACTVPIPGIIFKIPASETGESVTSAKPSQNSDWEKNISRDSARLS